MDSISALRGIIFQKVRLLVVCVESHTDTRLYQKSVVRTKFYIYVFITSENI
jgi:hypothetical protein